jgi:NAD-dependent deacetylase
MAKLHKYKSIVILTGAGISAESGIQTFRDQNGLWENHRLEDVATPEAFKRDPGLVQKFYNMRRQQLLSETIKPNAAHMAIAELQKTHPDIFLVTQNIDNLHERSGSPQVHHMHGELLKTSCTACPHIGETLVDLSVDISCIACGKNSTTRPHIVWFGEMPLEMDMIFDRLMNCDLFISIGTSGNVYPAAGFVQEARMAGAHTVELNLEPSMGSSVFAEHHHGKATDIVPDYLKNHFIRLK